MIYEVTKGRSCDSLARYQNEVIERSLLYIDSQDSLLNVRAEMIDNYSKKEDIWRGLYNNQKKQTKIQEKEKRKWKTGTFMGGGATVGSLAGPIGIPIGAAVGWIVSKVVK